MNQEGLETYIFDCEIFIHLVVNNFLSAVNFNYLSYLETISSYSIFK